jgi:DNA end-binding protein Ku
MAASLIESMTVDFDPDAYHDGYREALQELVNAKVEGREVVQPQIPGEEPEPTSLADALKASLAAAREAPRQAGTVRAEVKGPRRAITGSTKAREPATAKDGEAGTGRGGGARASRGRGGGVRAGGTVIDGAKDGEAKTGSAKTSAAKGAQRPAAKRPAKEGGASAQPRSKRQAS